MTYSFGDTFKHEQYEIVEVYAFYDSPLTYLLKDTRSETHYLVNLIDSTVIKNEHGYHVESKELFTLLTETMRTDLTEERKMMRELMIEGLDTETFILEMTGEDYDIQIHPVTKETLMRDVLSDPGYYAFKAGE